MKAETLTTLRAILAADTDTPTEQADRILQACRQGNPRRRLGSKHEAAAILDIHPESVKRYARRGLLHPIKITARRVRYDLDEASRLANYGAAGVEG